MRLATIRKTQARAEARAYAYIAGAALLSGAGFFAGAHMQDTRALVLLSIIPVCGLFAMLAYLAPYLDGKRAG